MYFMGSQLSHFIHTILLDSELVAVLADPSDRRTVKAAAKCLNASVSGPPPATAKSCRNNNIEAWLFPDPLVPERPSKVLNQDTSS